MFLEKSTHIEKKRNFKVDHHIHKHLKNKYTYAKTESKPNASSKNKTIWFAITKKNLQPLLIHIQQKI